jgi:hypothetical protein
MTKNVNPVSKRARQILLGRECAATLPKSVRKARVDTHGAILLGNSAVEVLTLIIDCAAAAIALSVLRIGGYRRIAIIKRLVESALATKTYCSARTT